MSSLVGLDAKLKQYEQGERFIEAVEKAGGRELFERVWQGPEWLPTWPRSAGRRLGRARRRAGPHRLTPGAGRRDGRPPREMIGSLVAPTTGPPRPAGLLRRCVFPAPANRWCAPCRVGPTPWPCWRWRWRRVAGPMLCTSTTGCGRRAGEAEVVRRRRWPLGATLGDRGGESGARPRPRSACPACPLRRPFPKGSWWAIPRTTRRKRCC